MLVGLVKLVPYLIIPKLR